MDANRFFSVSYDASANPKVLLLEELQGDGMAAFGRWIALLSLLYDNGGAVMLDNRAMPYPARDARTRLRWHRDDGNNHKGAVAMNQCDMIIEYMELFGSITTFQAFQDLGVTRLASRVHDLRVRGHEIESEIETGTNRFGETVHFKKYWLKDME